MKKMLNKSSILPLAAAVLAVVTAIVYAGAKARENAPAIIILLAAAAVLELVAVAVRKASWSTSPLSAPWPGWPCLSTWLLTKSATSSPKSTWTA